MVMVMIRCNECYNYKSLNRRDIIVNEKNSAFFRQLYVIESHMYCLDCLKQCKTCMLFILQSHNIDYCKRCDKIIKRHLISNTCNDITMKLPPELVEMIVSFV
jgi:hypothetical protein